MKIVNLMYNFFFKTQKYTSRKLVKLITPTPDKVVRLIVILAFFFYMAYISEPIHCSAPDPWMNYKAYVVNKAQKDHWEALIRALRAAEDIEIQTRITTGTPSRVVTLSDVGVGWQSHDNPNFGRFPGLSSLYAVRPNWFQDRGQTRVANLAAQIESDPTLT